MALYIVPVLNLMKELTEVVILLQIIRISDLIKIKKQTKIIKA